MAGFVAWFTGLVGDVSAARSASELSESAARLASVESDPGARVAGFEEAANWQRLAALYRGEGR